jgi:hypothetical protein
MRAGVTIAALGLLGALAAMPAAQAGNIRITAPSPAAASVTDSGDAPAGQSLSADESALLGKALSFDATIASASASAPSLHLPGTPKPQPLDVTRTDNDDGSSAVTVKQPLTTNQVEANVGADLNTAPTPVSTYQPDKPFPSAANNPGSGAAWASVGLPNLASVNARLDPTAEQGKLGTTFSHTVPVGDDTKLTLADSYSVTESYNQPASPTASITGLPVPAASVPATPTAQPSAQVYGTDKSVKLDFGATGTTLSADINTASNDPITHNSLSADQKIYGPLHVTTALSDIGQPTASKSISAGLKIDW